MKGDQQLSDIDSKYSGFVQVNIIAITNIVIVPRDVRNNGSSKAQRYKFWSVTDACSFVCLLFPFMLLALLTFNSSKIFAAVVNVAFNRVIAGNERILINDMILESFNSNVFGCYRIHRH